MSHHRLPAAPARRLHPALVALALTAGALAASGLSCSGPSEEELALRERAQAFGELMLDLRDLPEDTARERLVAHLEPTPGLDDQVEDYLDQAAAASGRYRAVESTVEDIDVSDDGSRASVTYLVVARGPDGAEITAAQVTEWRHSGGQWYRTARPAEKSLR